MKRLPTSFKSAPFSFTEIMNAPPVTLLKPQFLKAADGVHLAYYHFCPEKKPVASLIFIHGAGAHCYLPDYQRMGYELKDKYQIETYLLDLRGHGNSEGRRGDSPTPTQVWEDISTVINLVKSQNEKIPLILGGHSAGAGVAINYATWRKGIQVEGYVFIAPYLGYKSKSSRHSLRKDPFAYPKLLTLAINKATRGRWLGNKTGAYYNYPEEQIKRQPLLITSVSCNMVTANTLWNPKRQFNELGKPVGLYIGSDDEQFDPQKVLQYIDYLNPQIRGKSEAMMISGANHLSVLIEIGGYIGEFITKKIVVSA